MARPFPVIDSEALRLLLLSGASHAAIAAKYKVTPRSVKRQIQRERESQGEGWPLTGQAVKPPKAAAQARVDEAVLAIPPPPEDASPDELEAYALRVWVAESQAGRGADRIAAAGKIVELARERRSRRDPADDAPDPDEVAALAMREIERATENVTPVTSTDVDNVH